MKDKRKVFEEATDVLINENQFFRGFMNYTNDLYDLLEGKEFEFDEIIISEKEAFLHELKDAVKWQLQIIKTEKEEDLIL